MSNVVLILGAGCSAGSVGLPVDKDFLRRTANSKKYFLQKALNKLYQPDGVSDYHWSSYRLEIAWSEIYANQKTPKIILKPEEIEEIYQQLRQYADDERNEKRKKKYYSFFQYDDEQSRSPYEYLFKFAEWELRTTVFEECNKKLPDDKKHLYEKLLEYCKALGDKLEIVSFNYDTLIEEALQNCYYLGLEDKSEGLGIVKPHGSVNWMRMGPRMDWNSSYSLVDFGYENNILCEPLLLGLIDKKQDALKDFENFPFSEILKCMHQSLWEAHVVVIIGYSFPTGDRHVRNILKKVKSNRKNRDLPLEKIIMVSHSQDSEVNNIKADLRELFYINDDNIEVRTERWEEWILSVLKTESSRKAIGGV